MNDTDLKICEDLIIDQIESRISVEIQFKDVEWEFLSLYKQKEDNKDVFIMQPAFCPAKKITKTVYNDLIKQFTTEQKWDGSRYREFIKTSLTYDAFYNKYYNKKGE